MPETPSPPEPPKAPPAPPEPIPYTLHRSDDAQLMFSPVANPVDGLYKTSDTLMEKLSFETVGRFTGVTIRVSTALRPFYELGRRSPVDLRAGHTRITGTAERGYLNGALLYLLLQEWAMPEAQSELNVPPPAFNLLVSVGYTNLILYETRLDGWDFSVPNDDFVMERVSFEAMRIEYQRIY